MKQKQLVFIKDDVTYNVFVTYKYQRNIYFRYRDGAFYVSAPLFTSDRRIEILFNKFFPKLVKPTSANTEHYSFSEDFVYILGEKESLSSLNIQNEEELQRFLKKKAFDFLSEEVQKYQQIMGISVPYRVRIANTKNQYGSNSKKTHTLSFQTKLIHYSIDIIDTVVVHELAHEFERNHQKHFYEIVYKYSPNYKELQKKLKRGIHK